MKLIFKQKAFSLLDSYKVYDENDEVLFTIKAKMAFGYFLKIYNPAKEVVGTIKQKKLSLFPKFRLTLGDKDLGFVSRKLGFCPKYVVDYKNWEITGNVFEYNYEIKENDQVVATISKQIFKFTDTYIIDVVNPADAIYALMVVTAIDAEKAIREKNNGND